MNEKSIGRKIAVKDLIERILKIENNNLNSVYGSHHYDFLRDRDVYSLVFIFNSTKVPDEVIEILNRQDDMFEDGESIIDPCIEFDTDVLPSFAYSNKIYPN